MDHLLPVRTIDNLMSAGQTARYLPLKGKTMTDTITRPAFAFVTGTFSHSDEHHADMPGVEYTYLDRDSRFDWFNHTQGRDEALAAARRRYDNGETHATYNILSGGWVWTPDVAPVEEGDTSREAQGQAIAAMRQRVTTAEREISNLQDTVNSRGNRIAALEAELRDLWAALLQQAEERDWCGEFEEFHENNGGEEWLALETEVEVTMTITVRGRGGDNREAAVNAIYDMDRSDLRSNISVD